MFQLFGMLMIWEQTDPKLIKYFLLNWYMNFSIKFNWQFW